MDGSRGSTRELLVDDRLDEPFSGLDPINAQALKDAVLELKRRGKTVVFSTHIMDNAEKMCDSVCIIARGEKVLDGTVVLSPRGLSRQSDDEVIARLSTVRGIGPWTAQMFLIFRLRRLDVWPVGDFGVRQGYGFAWKVPMPTARELEPLGNPYRPYRTVVALLCWRAVELYAAGTESALTR